ncbi:hypothetical protein [Nocardia terpenica]|uniref:hypothetical protein n=1 Tax=Nocardia terpenica TaxID=455432 RepID=UPI00142E672C|nr:hypothetical protein [Nocardia terpenica]
MDDNRCRASDLVSAASEDIGYNNYDEFAYGYASDNEKTPFNTLYERPAILALAGDVRGRRVLDAGCGAGGRAAELILTRN